MAEKKNVPIGFRVTETDIKKIDEFAESEGRDRSNWIYNVITAAIKRKEESNLTCK